MGSFFSGGLDSFYTFLKHRDEMNELSAARARRVELGAVCLELSDIARTAHTEDEAARYRALLDDKQSVLAETQT